MREVPVVSEALLDELLSFEQAIEALAEAYAVQRPPAPPRAVIPVPQGELLLMPAHGAEGVGVKLVTINPANPEAGRPLVQGVYVLFSADGLTPELIIDGAALTGRRTAAVSALATDRLARQDARRLIVFGAGRQARSHVEAMREVRDIESVGIVGRDPGRAAGLAEAVRTELRLDASVADPSSVREADLICTCTTSQQPLFDDGHLPLGTHVNAIGAYRPDMREVPAATLARALVAVESREAALAEAGDLIQAGDEGIFDPAQIAGELPELADRRMVRTAQDQITVFKSVGIASEDLVLARAVRDRLG